MDKDGSQNIIQGQGRVIIFWWTSESWVITFYTPLSMVIGWELDKNLVPAMENKRNECFPSISDGALIPPR